MTIYIPAKVKGFKRLVRAVDAIAEMVTDLRTEMRTTVTDALGRIDSSLTNLGGDLQRLTDAASALSAAYDTLAASHDADVSAADQAGYDRAKEEFDTAAGVVADKAEALAAINPEPETPDEPPVEPPVEPGEPPVVDEPDGPVPPTPAAQV